MILPDKHIPLGQSLLGVGAVLLSHLDRPTPVSSLWDRCRKETDVATFERFVTALDFLFSITSIDFKDGLLVKTR